MSIRNALAPATPRAMTSLFSKMHGLGNDVVVLDLREAADPTPEQCRALSDRHTGVGCDMILGIKKSRSPGSVAAFSIWTADGSPSLQCGNGARCVAAWVTRAGMVDAPHFLLDSPSGPLAVNLRDDGAISIAMGVPRFPPPQIPMPALQNPSGWYDVALEDTAAVRLAVVSMGNSHAVVEVNALEETPVVLMGKSLQASPLLPKAINICFARIISRQRLALRVFEYGAGETLACGTGACAAAATFMRDGRLDRKVAVELPGGKLDIHWPVASGAIFMTGPAAFVFEGKFFHASI